MCQEHTITDSIVIEKCVGISANDFISKVKTFGKEKALEDMGKRLSETMVLK
jgi:hypothetical protein